MEDPKKRRYIYLMLSGFGAISLSVILFLCCTVCRASVRY